MEKIEALAKFLGIETNKIKESVNNDGIFEFVTTQYVLYSLDEIATSNKTIGKIEIYYNINGDKLVFNKVEINI